MQLFTALQLQEVPSKFLHFPDEGHWIQKPRNSILWYETVTDWLDKWIDEPHTPTSPPVYQRPDTPRAVPDEIEETTEPVSAVLPNEQRPSPIQR